MNIILVLIIVIAALAAIVVFIFSNEGNPKERAKEAGSAALFAAFQTSGCIIQLILSTIPFLLGLFFMGLIVKSCQ